MYKCNRCACSCPMNQNYNKNSAIETICDNMQSCPCTNQKKNQNKSGCGFQSSQSIFPTNPMLGQSYVPIQYMDKTFTPKCGLKKGTLFPELVNQYYPGQSMMDIDYLKMTSN